ncbi:amino acid adenylation domain-containing protein [Amycolatopsis sp. 195334CR]|uniref:non-ribosomal peptide synthetase n=1 Tax=Amycolatopsis sp. 195334CR TaxID=2814588 RepID=UPI001A8CD31F|nr:amino acid adenylation domain-containing protein [Amycolatopsis sp. 195334CR]MBN6039848.1 amino acid adenylation domain-containing protein [Amycolatopsis sp. 195334CR]
MNREFWTDRLTGFAEPTRLGGERGTDAHADAVAERESASLAGLKQAGAPAGVPPEHVVVAAWTLVLAAHAGTDDVVFGVRPAGVDRPTPLRVRLRHDLPLTAFFASLRAQLEAGLAEPAPTEAELAEIAGLAEGTALFDKVVRWDHGTGTEHALELRLDLDEPNVRLRLAYAAGRIGEADARRLLDDLDAVLTEMVARTGATPLHEFSVLSPAEQHRITHEWNDTAVARTPACIHELVERQAARTPDALAVLQGAERLTYAELDTAAGKLARRLAAAGVGPGDFVALRLRRSVHTVVALLGVLKAGAAYAPIEPSLPTERARELLATLNAPVLITDRDQVAAARELGEREILWLGEPDGSEGWALADSAGEPRRAQPDDLAYVIFTSGSTGTPKGVLLSHAPVVNLIEWVNTTHGMGPADRVLFITSLGFDLSVYDVFGVLAAGGSVRVATDEEIRDPRRLLSILAEEPITFWDSAPAALQQLEPFFTLRGPRAEHSLRLVFLSGDWVPVTLPDSVRAAFGGARVIALGGATEAAIWSNSFPVERVDPGWASIPYGRPIDNARYYVLDGALRPAVVGAPGDLFIGGDCLALGYHGDPEKTAEKFIPDPFSDRLGARLYRTGDRAKYWPDGTIEFLGRQDDQVKLRGFRIELGEVEAALTAAPGVASAVALVQGAQLVGYVVRTPGDDPDPAEVRDQLARRLPAYMVPSQVVVLDELPVTPNGKLDRRALPAPKEPVPYVEPGTPVEKALAELWIDVLGVERVGVVDNFFDLGGHSLLITQLMARVKAVLEVDVPMMAVLDNQTLGEFAAVVEAVLLEELDA